VSIVGVGLIGGSVALALRERLGARVTAFDPHPTALEKALQMGVIDAAAQDIAAAVEGADVVFVAAPVGRLSEVVEQALAAAPADCAVTDVGSAKRALVSGCADQRFVGGHPLAGAETAGVAHARADLFEGATWYLTPTSNTSGILYERLHRMLVGIGARPVAIDADAHDRAMASVSHLPHVLANVLVAHAANALSELAAVPATGPSFRDATRVAGANSAIWTDIYLANCDALIDAIEDAQQRLEKVRLALRAGDPELIGAWNDEARADRDRLLGSGLVGGPVHQLCVAVPNRPGVIAEIALALGRGGVNIVDMALSPSPDYSQGEVALWVRGDEHAERAAQLIAELEFAVARA
jgi:prephenate dehydrogenase